MEIKTEKRSLHKKWDDYDKINDLSEEINNAKREKSCLTLQQMFRLLTQQKTLSER